MAEKGSSDSGGWFADRRGAVGFRKSRGARVDRRGFRGVRLNYGGGADALRRGHALRRSIRVGVRKALRAATEFHRVQPRRRIADAGAVATADLGDLIEAGLKSAGNWPDHGPSDERGLKRVA